LEQKKIIIGVCGSIAAYKAALLVRLLVKANCEVQVIMTQDAKAFISPLTLATLSKNAVLSDFSQSESTGLWNNHVELGLWADLILLAPATANTMAKLANGICDNLLLATCLSARCPIVFAPAMDLDMYQYPATQKNIQTLLSYGHELIPAESGELASGLEGEGRLAEPEHIVSFVENYLSRQTADLANKTILITAGPTYEHLDPVRFIGNLSSGKMGIALAEEAAKRGAKVHLVLGPTHHKTDQLNIQTHNVISAQDMYEACVSVYEQCDIAILAAAVADFTPINKSDQKIKKKKSEGMHLELGRTKDILKHLGSIKQNKQLLIGFALETQDGIKNAKGKLEKKNLDFIVLNSLADKGAGFKHDTNKITILDRDNKQLAFELKTKKAVAKDILDYAVNMI
ncbi:UNVERIFIED_CONTAM: hypothetical protein GTU68_042239, partial [Idotea baltica]|nr:hypothetical protein [Idotea baltica]